MDLKNSMLLANMMSQKQNIMYATIKGSLTENDGVFSGFSASNYLLTQTEIQANESFSGKVRAKVNSGETGYTGILNIVTGSKRFCIEFNTTTSIRTYCYNDTTSSNQAQGKYNIISADTWFDFYFNFDSGAKTLYISIRNTNGTEVGRIDYTNVSLNGGNIQYGYVFSGLNGSIDLNNSYIKLGSTKYNLQAVVGYTVVGSPTIVDGVVSGFSSSDYLKLYNMPYNSFVGRIRAKVDSDASGYIGLLNIQGNSPARRFTIEPYNLNSVRYYHYDTTSSTNIPSSFYIGSLADKWIDYDFSYSLDTKSLTVTITDVSTGTLQNTQVFENFDLGGTTDEIWIGNIWSAFQGSIDLNNTYIKINNKLWFNGQQA